MKRYYYERDDGAIVDYSEEIDVAMPFGRLTRRVYITPTDPAEVVAELRARAERARKVREKLLTNNYGDSVEAFDSAADLVAEKLGVES